VVNKLQKKERIEVVSTYDFISFAR